MKFTARGGILLGLSIILIGAGFIKIDGILITLGSLGMLLIVTAVILGRANLRNLKFEVIGPKRTFAGNPFDLRITLLNQRRLFDAFDIQSSLRLGESTFLEAHSPWTAANSSSTTKVRGPILERGTIEQHPCSIESNFPLGLFNFRSTCHFEHEIMVFPMPIVPNEFSNTGQLDDSWTGEGFLSGDAPGEPRGIRPFRPGDRTKQWHWPATIRSFARGRSPRVREYDPPGFRPRQIVVIFHSFGTDNTLIRTDLFERALSLLCGTLRHLRGISIPTTVVADFLDWHPHKTLTSSTWSNLLTLFSSAERARHTEAHDIMIEVESIPSDHAIVMISDMPMDSWSHILPDRKILPIDIDQHQFKKKEIQTLRQPHAMLSPLQQTTQSK